LELEKALDAQTNVYKTTTSTSQKAIAHWIERYNEKKKECDDLEEKVKMLKMQQQVEDEIKKINLGEDEVDGSNVGEEETALSISDDVSTDGFAFASALG
jgi:lipopolysaccharide biosynthesis regulator YciM